MTSVPWWYPARETAMWASVSTPPAGGLCAERSPMAAMITDGEYRIRKVVAVWPNHQTGQLHVLPPCGVCREFMRQVDDGNFDAEIVLNGERTKTLGELIL